MQNPKHYIAVGKYERKIVMGRLNSLLTLKPNYPQYYCRGWIEFYSINCMPEARYTRTGCGYFSGLPHAFYEAAPLFFGGTFCNVPFRVSYF